MAYTYKPLEILSINTIRTLSMDAVQAANSGHPGTPMALAPVTYLLFNELMNYDPADPVWANRDRFILSCGHASMLLYSTLHLAGVRQLDHDGKPTGEEAVRLEDIRRFRQLESRCPGHPEYGHTSGVETTTGPLGQGIGNSVGFALAERWLAARYNKPGYDIFDYNIYTLCSDGDLMEGVGAEAASVAGHLKLSNLCWIYDNNTITIEGHTTLAFTENVSERFRGYGWNVIEVADVNDLAAMRAALADFKKTTDRPTFINVHSIIGYGSPNKANTHNAHGAPLGEDEIKLTKQFYGWPVDQKFLVPPEVMQHFKDNIGQRGAAARKAWETKFADYKKQFPELAGELEKIESRELPSGWDSELKPFPADPKGMATRASSGKALNQLAKKLPWLVGGSADLAPSTLTLIDGATDFEAGHYDGRNLHFGIREHAMGAIVNGMTLSGLRGYGSTFFVFSDYMRPSIRMAAIMELPSLFIFTHDSIGVGEDGPTHQPIEHLAALRAIPKLIVFRPGDANEVTEAYRSAVTHKHNPVAVVLSRQNMATLDRTKYAPAAGVAKGGYILADAKDGKPTVILLGTGTELSLCVEAYEKLTAEGIAARVVSMPCWEIFDDQPESYRNEVLPPTVTNRVAVELGLKMGWERYLGSCGRFVGMSSYGASAPVGVLLKHFGVTVEHVVAAAKEESKC